MEYCKERVWDNGDMTECGKPVMPDGGSCCADHQPMEMGVVERRVAQVGGTHYQANYQHWDWVEDIGMGYLEAVATKYLVRWQNKDGLKDLKKALSYVEKLIFRIEGGRRNRVDVWDYALFRRYCQENNIQDSERDATLILYNWSKASDLSTVCEIIRSLIHENFPETTQSKMGGDSYWQGQ